MRLLSLADLMHTSFSVAHVSCLDWRWKPLDFNDYTEKGRVHNLLFYQTLGERRYFIKDTGKSFILPPNAMMLMPNGSRYRTGAAETNGDTLLRGFVAHFDLYDRRGAMIQLTDPILMDKSPECQDYLSLFRNLHRHAMAYPTEAMQTAVDVMQILHVFAMNSLGRDNAAQSISASIQPALELIQSSLQEEVSIQTLCEACHLSESTFRRRFHACTGMSPIKYRNLLRVRKAKAIYDEMDISVEDIAEILGFCDAPYLCRTYKLLTGKTFSDR